MYPLPLYPQSVFISLDVGSINPVTFESLGSGYFMHFDTGTTSIGDTALLESRLLYPKRGYQCLEFFYYNSAGPSDTLKIYVREYDKANPDGKLRFIKTIDGEQILNYITAQY